MKRRPATTIDPRIPADPWPRPSGGDSLVLPVDPADWAPPAAWLATAVATALAAQDWRFTRTGRRWLLRKPFVADGRVQLAHSVIERVELPAMASFHRVLGCLLGRELPAPPPHVTLYVAGRPHGIGLSSEARLRAFAVREVSGPL